MLPPGRLRLETSPAWPDKGAATRDALNSSYGVGRYHPLPERRQFTPARSLRAINAAD
jgi:hypothetical protein